MNVPDELYCTAFVYGKLLFTLGATEDKNPHEDEYIQFGKDKNCSAINIWAKQGFFTMMKMNGQQTSMVMIFLTTCHK